ncbi:MAG: hypothetical protein H0V01_10290 [Bacteroidetes bacterium]|nr:hypothetical protein [Bacteroidota bacterium]HET6246049.1 hypothetical protein [Bacteroidia bacterium]
MKYNIEIIYSKFLPSRFEDDDDLTKASDDFKYFPIEIPVNVDNYGQIYINLNYYLKADFKFPLITKECKCFNKNNHLYLKYSFIIETELNEHDFSNLIWLIAKKVSEFSIALQIALPGFVHFSKGYVFSNGKFLFKKDPLFSICQEMLPVISEIGWPKLTSIEPLIVWRWIEKNFNGLDNFSTNNTQRAVFAFTNVFDKITSHFHIDLIWIMIALESLYTRNNVGVKEQLMEKIPLLLGETKEFKSIINKLYSFRSNFLHGNTDIPSKFNFNEEHDENIKFMFKYFDTTAISTAILIATFQYMVLNNKEELVFKFSLVKK